MNPNNNIRIYILLFLLFIPTLLISQNNNAQDSLMLKGIYFYNNKNTDSAKFYLNNNLKINKNNDAAYYYLAKIAALENDLTTSEILLKRAIELDTSNFWYANTLGEIYMQTDKIDNALSIFNDLVLRYPKKTDSYYNLVNLYLSKQDLIRASELLDKIEQISGRNEGVVMTKFNIFRMEQNWEGALKYLVEADKELQSPRVQVLIGDMYADRFKDSLAIQYYNKALKSDLKYAPALFGRAEVYRISGDFDSYFNDIIPFFADKEIDSQMKEEYLKQLFQTPNFIQRYRAQVDTMVNNLELSHPTDSNTLFLVAAYYSQGEDTLNCTRVLKHNYSLYPQSFDAMFQYITYLYHIERWEAVKKESEIALANFPNNSDLLQLIGISNFRLKNVDKAIDTYKKLEKIALENKDTSLIITSYSMVGDLSYEIGDKKQAYSYYKKALKWDPKNASVLNNYAYYLALEGKSMKQAYEMSKKTVELEPDNPTYLDTFGWILYLMGKPLEAKAQFKHALIYGGKDNPEILSHYSTVLEALGEIDLASIYKEQAKKLKNK